MCSNYRPVTRLDRLLTFFGVERGRDEAPVDVFCSASRRSSDCADGGTAAGRPSKTASSARCRVRQRDRYGRKTYNARSETVAGSRASGKTWRPGQRCIVPAECIFEPNWETGKAVRWRIGQAGEVPMGIAGIYDELAHPDGREMSSFAMLTVNADAHPLMRRFHRPGEERRIVVILDPADYAAWLSCPVAEARRFCKVWPGPLDAFEEPLPPRAQPGQPADRATAAPAAARARLRRPLRALRRVPRTPLVNRPTMPASAPPWCAGRRA